MGVRIEEHGAGPVGRLADPELALEDVPDLGEIVLVEGMVRPGLVPHQPRVGLGGALRPGVEEHLAPLAGPAQRFPVTGVGVHRLERLMGIEGDGVGHGGPPVSESERARGNRRAPREASAVPYC